MRSQDRVFPLVWLWNALYTGMVFLMTVMCLIVVKIIADGFGVTPNYERIFQMDSFWTACIVMFLSYGVLALLSWRTDVRLGRSRMATFMSMPPAIGLFLGGIVLWVEKKRMRN